MTQLVRRSNIVDGYSSYFSNKFSYNYLGYTTFGCVDFNTVEFIYVFVVNDYIEFIVENAYGRQCFWYIRADVFFNLVNTVPCSVSNRTYYRSKLRDLVRFGNRYAIFQIRFYVIDCYPKLPQKFNIYSHRTGIIPKGGHIYRVRVTDYTQLGRRFINDVNATIYSDIRLLPRYIKIDSYILHMYYDIVSNSMRILNYLPIKKSRVMLTIIIILYTVYRIIITFVKLLIIVLIFVIFILYIGGFFI